MGNEQKDIRPTNWWAFITFGLIILILIWGFWKGCQPPQPKITYRDTIYLDSFIYVPTTKYVYVEVPNTTGYTKPPLNTSTQIKWRGYSIGYGDTIYLKDRDSTTYTINAQFLVNYPKNPKLIRQALTQDSTTYDFYHPDGRVWTNTYPLYLDRYNYVWENDSMKVQKKKFLHQIQGESWAYGSYNILQNAPRLAVDYTLNYRSVGLFGRFTLSPKKPYTITEIGTKVKLR